MAILVDTSVLVRLANRADVEHALATNAVVDLHRAGESLTVTSQVLIEFRSVATRPIGAANGLGMSSENAISQVTVFETVFAVVPESPEVFPAWKQLVAKGDVLGKQVHDARLLAICEVNGITGLLTFNTKHMERLARIVGGVTIMHPAHL